MGGGQQIPSERVRAHTTKTPKRLGEADSAAVGSAMAAGSAPGVQPRSRGLIFSTPGTREGLRLIDNLGSLTPDGTRYYQTSCPNEGFDCGQEPVRRRARVQNKFLGGSPATVQSWDGVRRRWRFTKLGQFTAIQKISPSLLSRHREPGPAYRKYLLRRECS